jgi:hypothetical protein
VGPQRIHKKGYVTTLASIQGRSRVDIEQRLGFGPGSLAPGYGIYALEGPVLLREFEWKDQTAYTDGWHFDPSVRPFNEWGDPTVYGVQRRDELRAHLGKVHNYNEAAVDKALDAIMRVQLAKLNVRGGSERIIKVVPRSKIPAYPSSPFRNIPQWTLTVDKPFVLLSEVGRT